MRLEAPFLELPGDNGRGPTLLEADLGMSVKIPSDRREFVGERFNLVDRGHGHTRLVEGSGKEVASTTAPKSHGC
jgi:hypothetical protein